MTADVVLSILPPAQALPFARKTADVLNLAARKPLYVDCNAVSPATVLTIQKTITQSGASLVDGSIIRSPPKADAPPPRSSARGSHGQCLSAQNGVWRHNQGHHRVADPLNQELRESDPEIYAFLAHRIIDMLPKAYRWVAEMHEVSRFLSTNRVPDTIFEGLAQLYERLSIDILGPGAETVELTRFFEPRPPRPPA